eukprot:TRINITY_DN1080_c2_g1_i1.p1 TRINITY_DN1080_c2_g1~~TRINITY_DN1080_c2_g1_i1.p1  ORF type:complete len:379 (+),score=62.70 TRINITY_DN1080_c2_g1_i1:46-1182(+)
MQTGTRQSRPPTGNVSSNKIITPLVLAAFLFVLVFNVLYAPNINTHVAISSVYEGITDEEEVASQQRGKGRLRFTTILTEPRKYHCTMLASAAMNNISLDVYGWGDTELHGVRGWWRKILWFKEMSKKYPDDDVIVFVDAGDSLFNTGMDEIRLAYITTANVQKLKHHNEFIWSAEMNCGMKTLTKEECKNLHDIPSTVDTPYRWLNSGGWAGRASVAKQLFETVDTDRNGRTNQADQAFIAESHVKRGWKYKHGLDYSQLLWMSVYLSEKKICGWPEIQQPLRNCATSSTPAIFHFNAGAKKPEIFDKVLHSTQWWKAMNTPEGLKRVEEHVITVNGKEVKVKDMCPTGYGLVEDKAVKEVKAQIHLGDADKPELTA